MTWTVEGDRPSYCPWCGRELTRRSREGRELPYCDSCDRTLYRNPVPMARATVVDGDRALLIERGAGADVGEWALAGGHVEADEPPAVAAARELAEETGLVVDRRDLAFLGTGFLEFETGHTMISINYASPASAASGTLEVGSDAADARFWSREELVDDPPLLRASGLDQVLTAIDAHGDG